MRLYLKSEESRRKRAIRIKYKDHVFNMAMRMGVMMMMMMMMMMVMMMMVMMMSL